MGYTEFENGQSPYLSKSTLMEMQKGLMKLVFPIGATYITQDETNPSDILKFGTWERLKGKLALGLDEETEEFNEIGKEGGETKHTMTTQEMPSHTHGLFINEGNDNAYRFSPSSNKANVSSTANLSFTGNGQAFNITQPYKVVGYMWIRTA